MAALIRRLGDWDLAEECAAEAFAEATRRWPTDGVPERPGAWLTTVAGNRAMDRLRRMKRGNELLEQIGADPTRPAAEPGIDQTERIFETPEAIADDRLALIFTCCHPALALEARVALTLRMLGGLSTAELARAFLVEEAAMAKRLTRAKAKIAAAAIPYRVPGTDQLGERLSGVMAVLYLMFNEGYARTSGEGVVRADLCDEAIRLARLLAELLPAEAEVAGLTALMLLNDSRRLARVDAAGELVTLEDQDRRRWNHAQIDEGRRVLLAALSSGEAGPYMLQAAIAACHAQASDAADTDWPQIAALYELLASVTDTPVIRLNQAVAVALAGDLAAGLARIGELEAGGELSGYHLLAAARADLLRRAGRLAASAAAYEQAIAEAPDGPERRFLQSRLAEVTERHVQRGDRKTTRRLDGDSP